MKHRSHIAALALALALPRAAAGQTAITVYSSARPGSLDPRVVREGGEGQAVPGYALVREEREFELASGRTALRVADIPGGERAERIEPDVRPHDVALIGGVADQGVVELGRPLLQVVARRDEDGGQALGHAWCTMPLDRRMTNCVSSTRWMG